MESVFTESHVTMLKVGKKAVLKYTMAKLFILITILLVNGYQVKAVSLIQGQEATLHFPYPCDSTEVTLQHSYRIPFYRSSDASSLSLSQDQLQRYKVQNRNNTDNCSLEFTISNLMRSDQGTYISLVYKDGEILEQMHRIWLRVDYPPGKASCVVSEDKGGEWVSIDCTANIGSLSGEFECYQDGVWMPPLTDPTHTDTLLKQTILIRKSQPVFCCSSTLIDYTEICDCDDTALYLDDASSSDPCPSISTETSTTSTYRIPDLVNKSQSSNSSNYPLPSQTTSTNANNMTPKKLKAIIIYYILVTSVIILLILNAISYYQSINSNDESQDLKAIIIYYFLATGVVLLLILNTISYYQSINSNDESQDLFKIIIYYILATGVVILIILNVISLYRSRKKCKNNSNDESQDPSVSSKVHGDDAQECETEKSNQPLQEFVVQDFQTQNVI